MKELSQAVEKLSKLQGITSNVVDTVQASTSIKAKLKRDSVEMKVQDEYNRMEQQRLRKDQVAENTYCDRQRNEKIITRPLVPLEGDASDGIVCLNTNRDRIIDAFCNFRIKFDEALKASGKYKKTRVSGKAFWPRICCANEGDCKDHKRSIRQVDMRPFVMAQGGKLTKEAVQSEVFDLLGRHSKGQTRANGLIYEGMVEALRTVGLQTSKVSKRMEDVFASMNLCGPRVFQSPGKETTNMCELFYSYTHLMKSFLEQFKEALESKRPPLRRKLLAFVERAERQGLASPMAKMMQQKTATMQKVDTLEKENKEMRQETTEMRQENKEMRQENKEMRQELEHVKKGAGNPVSSQVTKDVQTLKGQVAQLQPLRPSRPTSCLHDVAKLKFKNRQALQVKQDVFCKEYGLDLADSQVVNVAMVYLGDNWNGKGESKDAFLRRLQQNGKFSVTDQCTHDKMFAPKDVSIQEVERTDGKGKDWVLLMKLDWANEKGYLASQLQDSEDDNKCRKLDYLPYTEIGVQVYEDAKGCCRDAKDYWACAAKGCALTRLEHHWEEQPLSFLMTVTGSVFSWDLHESLLEGTQFTRPTKKNSLVLGKNVNDGKDAGPSFLEVGGGITKADFESFRENAVAERATAKDVLEGVRFDGATFTFECGTSERLCTELTAQSRRTEPMAFEHGGKSFALIGDGQFVYYEFEPSSQRRRLLQRRRRGC